MNCPYCRQPIHPQGEKCPSCGMDAEGVRRWLGVPPPLLAGFTDLTGELAAKDGKCFSEATADLRDRHPQCEFHWVHARLQLAVPLRIHAFHFFNHGRLCSPARSGGSNRDALLVTDPDRDAAALVVGYGVESFLQPGELDAVLAAGGPGLEIGDHCKAASAVVRAWEKLLDRVLDRLPRTFGLPAPGELTVGLDESVRAASLRQPSEY